ncbi:lysophospholipid acyltransferase family protein [Cellulophaga baltica]|uniref:GNAT family N-acyltransferase n=1 Tax=Cellulophaga TaxID=104264 RepID=UPI00051D17A3|nr:MULTISPECIES: lysophospholipid acyltransferase family protein [Cellulophaga]KGK32060.1 glycerol acyltransferase [Cellulophaga sp. E6(2014)]MCR1023504.1 lysophospholipid acyltransferase family protein [Cellulophaga baltica]
MGLVTAKEVAKAINIDKYGFLGTFIGWILMKVTRISSINRFYDKIRHLEGQAYPDAILKHFDIDFQIPEEDFKRLPKDGAFITISNHPLGAIDGIILIKLMMEYRPDFKIMTNFLLQRMEPLVPYIVPVNPFESHKNAKSSLSGFKTALQHLRDGHPLSIFPAGEVSTLKDGKLLVDRPWEEAALKLIKKAEVPVVPIYFHAKNSRLFYRLAKLNDVFRTAKIPSEVFSQKNRPIKVRIGQPIAVKVQKEQQSLEEYTELLRRKTYMLSNAYEKEGLTDRIREQIPTSLKLPKAPRKIASAISPELMEEEIIKLRDKGCRLLQSKNYEVFLAVEQDMPNILQEIGRQREVTFRAIGEGTNKAIDLDQFDAYYHHLFLWDEQEKAIVGAYRMGLGAEIFKAYGIDGFYLQDLFRVEPELYAMMSESIEMGRAYIVKEYQQKPMPLFLLWKGIVHTTLRFPEYKYLIGGVSISNQFSNFSKSLMIEFMKSNYWDPYVAQYIRPKKEFKVKLKDADKEFVFDETQADLNKFDKLIDEVEPGSLRLPVLIKKYIKQNAKVVAFNVDPLFNNSVDGLMYIKIADLPEDTVRPVMEEFQAELERKMAAGQDLTTNDPEN